MRNLLLSTVTLLMVPAVSFALPDFPTHTHTNTPIELKPVSHISGTKLAAVCFLGYGDCGNKGDDDYQLEPKEMCLAEGYNTTSCTLPSYLNLQCPYLKGYYKNCKEDKPRACLEAGYVTSCETGYVLDSSQSCPYESSYKKCKCNPCDGYDYTYAQATARGYVSEGSCQSCSETKYKRKTNPCLGYQACECGGAAGAAVCYTGTVQKYNSCKACCENKCSLASCPENHACDYEECSNKYCDKGCASGYTDMCSFYNTYGSSSCTTMGYRQQTCTGDTVLCPYDTTYKFCM